MYRNLLSLRHSNPANPRPTARNRKPGPWQPRIEVLELRCTPACTFQDPNIVCDSGANIIVLILAADHDSTQVFINNNFAGTTQTTKFHVDGGSGTTRLWLSDSAFQGGESTSSTPRSESRRWVLPSITRTS
jgi:hypothetical protein